MFYKFKFILALLIISLLFFINGVWAKDPHNIQHKRYDYTCKRCHLKNPYDTGGMLSRKELFVEVCLSCHQPPLRQPLISCLRAVKPDTAKILQEQILDFVLKIKEGRIVCESCHRVHIKKDESSLKPEYFFFLKQAERISPHKSNILCIFCHEKEPQSKEDPLNLKYNGDRILLCLQCHNNTIARADNHPINIMPSKDKGINVNEDIFRLYDRKVTCLTCHDIRCLREEERNPKFFRGGLYKERIDACLMCHTKESYKSVNPHEQFDEQGRIRIDRCQYCHIINTPSQD